MPKKQTRSGGTLYKPSSTEQTTSILHKNWNGTQASGKEPTETLPRPPDARGQQQQKTRQDKSTQQQKKHTLQGGATGLEGTRTGTGAAAVSAAAAPPLLAAASSPTPPPPAGMLLVQFVFCGAESADFDSASAAFCAFVCSRSFLAVKPAVWRARGKGVGR